MLTLFPYICAAFFLGLTTRSVGLPMLVYVAYHFCFYWPVVGPGLLDDTEYIVYYTLAYGMHAVLGFLFAWALNLPPLLFGYDGAVVPCDMHGKMLAKSGKFTILKYLYRLFIGMLVFWLIMGGTMAFEFIPMSLSVLGIVVAAVVIMVAVLIFFLSLWDHIPPRPFKVVQSVYRARGKNSCVYCNSDMTPDVSIYMGIYYFVTTLVFCIVFVTAPWWWQFYTVTIIFGVFAAGALLLRIVAGHPRKLVASARRTADKYARAAQHELRLIPGGDE